MKRIKKITIFLIIFITALTFPYKVLAQTNGIDVTVSPTSFDFTDIPGSTIQGKFRIRNNVETPVPFTITVGKLLPNGNYNDIVPTDPDPKDAFIHWIHFDEASISARPKEWTDVKFTITIPLQAAFGYYYAIRIRQANVTPAQQSPGSKVIGEVLIPILLDVKKPGAIAEGKIISFLPNAYINEYLPIDFTTTIKSTGNVHIVPRGNIFIHTGAEKDMAVLDVNDTSGAILPGGTRTFSSQWDDGFFVVTPVMEDGVPKMDKNNKPVTQLTINWNKLTSFRFGKYTANLLVVYDNGTKDVAMEASTSFWVIPYKIIGGIILSIVVLVLLIRFVIRWYIKREIRKYQK